MEQGLYLLRWIERVHVAAVVVQLKLEWACFPGAWCGSGVSGVGCKLDAFSLGLRSGIIAAAAVVAVVPDVSIAVVAVTN